MEDKWISVEERLPEEQNDYLCCWKPFSYCEGSIRILGTIRILGFSNNLEKVDENFSGLNRAGWYDYDSEYGFYEVDSNSITHWMPLPKLPK